METTKIYKKLLELQKTVKGLGRDAKGAGYDYVSGSKLLSFVRPKMDELGLLLKQEVVGIEYHREDYNTRNGAKAEMFTSVSMRFTWVDAESGETDENLFHANGMNGWDKGLGSALTYGERYFLLKYFHIATDEDDVDAIVREDAVGSDDNELAAALAEVEAAQSADELTQIWRNHPQLKSNKHFIAKVANSPLNPNRKQK